VPATPAETDPSVCYRHPDRTSWTLCARCGRTICAECQILTPAGVRCPDCVRETGGSVRWESTAKPAVRAKKRGMQRRSVASRVDAAARPVLTIAIAAIAVALWLVGYVTGNAPSNLLNSSPVYAVEVWRYVTTSLAYPAVGGAGVLIVLLNIAIFVYIGWGAERFFGWRRYGVIILVAGTAAAALCGIALGSSLGLLGAVWGMLGAFLVAMWDQPPVRNRLLITMAIWFLISLFFGNIIAVFGGAAGGIGTLVLLRRYDDRPKSRPSTPYLILTAALLGLVALAILSATVIAPQA
jgi:membrane associated rhomboid family serine protease